MFSEANGVRIVSAKVLHFALEGSVDFLLSSPVDRICMNSVLNEELLDTWSIRASSHRWVCTGMERARVNGAAQSSCCQEFRKGGIEVVRNEGGNDILFSVGDDEKVSSAGGVPVVAPSWTRKPTGLGSVRSWSGVFLICRCVHLCDIQLTTALIENESYVLD